VGGDFSIDLPCANWSRNGPGTQYLYRDRSGTTCNSLVLKIKISGNVTGSVLRRRR